MTLDSARMNHGIQLTLLNWDKLPLICLLHFFTYFFYKN